MEALLSQLLLAVTSLFLAVVGYLLRRLWDKVESMNDIQAGHSTDIALLKQAQSFHAHRRVSDEVP